MNKAFTLIELLIVVTIIGLLASIALPNFTNALIRAKIAKTLNNMNTVQSALEIYFLDKNTYPRWAQDNPNPGVDYAGFRDLTTPVAYTQKNAFINPFLSRNVDPFIFTGGELDPFFEMGTYKKGGKNARGVVTDFFDTTSFPKTIWLLQSSGPDAVDHYAQIHYPAPAIAYQSSNGLMSVGDIYLGGGTFVADWVDFTF